MNKGFFPPRRTNRSFVIREGRFTDGQKKAFQQLWPRYGVENENIEEFNPHDFFNKPQPLILDIGFGSGDSLLSLAQQRPDINFLGIEVYRPGIGAVMRKLAQYEVNNVRVMNVDAMQLLKANMTSNVLAGVMIWFPDPWPKKRHHKRRLVQENFIHELSRVMRDQAILHLASDWQPYIEFMLSQVAKVDCFTFLDTNENPLSLQRPSTRFEQRGLRKGHQVTDLIYRLQK